jgi:hypothetical protein
MTGKQMPSSEPVLVSFLLLAFKQQPFIKAAVKAALIQDYEPMELVISDDGSTDDAFQIIQARLMRSAMGVAACSIVCQLTLGAPCIYAPVSDSWTPWRPHHGSRPDYEMGLGDRLRGRGRVCQYSLAQLARMAGMFERLRGIGLAAERMMARIGIPHGPGKE